MGMLQSSSRTAFKRKKKAKKKKIQVLFPALHEEKSKRPAHSPPRVTHAHWWQQLGTGPTDSAARPKMNKNLAGASLPVSLHWYIKPGEKRQHQVPCGISQQGSSPISDLRGSGDLYLWMCFSVHFPFNDAEEIMSTQRKIYLSLHTALVSGSSQTAAWNWLEKLLWLVLLVVFWGKKKLPALRTDLTQGIKCSQIFSSKTWKFPNVLLESAFSCMAIPCVPGTSVP